MHAPGLSGGKPAGAFVLQQFEPHPYRCGKSPQGFLSEALTMTDAANPSGLTDEEAQEFHQYYIQGYLLWAAGAFFAHSLVWIWRPWF